MWEPVIKRVKTVSFKFLKGERDPHAVLSFLKYALDLDIRDIVGVGDEGRSSIFIKFAIHSQYDVLVTHHGGQKATLNDVIFHIIDVSSYYMKLSMKKCAV